MGRQGWIKIVILLALVAFGLLYLWPNEPKFKGRTISSWLADLDDGEAQKGITWSADRPRTPTQTQLEAWAAIRQMGTNALPGLQRLLQAREPALERTRLALKRWLVRHHLASSTFEYTQATPTTRARHRAALGLVALNGEVKPSVPALVPLFNDTEFCKEAALVLASMGPEGTAPLEAAVGTNQSSWQAVCSIWALAQFPTNAQGILPDITAGLTNTNPGFKHASAWAMTRVQTAPSLAVQVLTNAAGDQAIRYLCLRALASYGKSATSAVPFLVHELRGPRRGNSHDLLETLRALDPEVAAKLGAK